MYTAITTQEKKSILDFIDRALSALKEETNFVFLTDEQKVVVMNSLLDNKELILKTSSKKITEGYNEDGAWVHPESNGAFITWD